MRRYSSSSIARITSTPATAPMTHAPSVADPVAGAGDRHQAGEEAVDDRRRVPLLRLENITKTAARPPVQAASVVLVATRPTPALSMIESVEHGLKPYQPNQRIKPPMTAIVRSCGSIGPPPSRLNLRPSRGPSMIAPAIATHPPIECTTVEPAKSWKFMPRLGRKWPSRAHRREEAVRSPAPVAEDRIDEARDADRVEHVADEPRAADHRARADRRSAVGEGELEQVVRQDRNARGAVRRQDVDVLHEDQALGRIARIRCQPMKALPCAEHEREAPAPVQQAAHAGVEHAFDQHVDGFAIAAEAGFEHREAGLHAEHEKRAEQHPARVDRIDQVAGNGRLVGIGRGLRVKDRGEPAAARSSDGPITRDNNRRMPSALPASSTMP